MSNKNKDLTFIDLFCGCGGFSAGLERAGLTCLAGIDHNQHAIQTFKANHSQRTVALVKDMTKFQPEELERLIGNNHVELIVGGPPCQGFSSARQFSGSNSGLRLIDDPRRDLYKYFLKFVNHFRPKIFVMENVLGIKKMQNGIYFTAIQNDARKIGYRVVPMAVNTWEHGVPQKRIRQLFIGTLTDLPIFVPNELIQKTHSLTHEKDGLSPIVTLGEAIEDLPALNAGDERIIQDYDLELRSSYLEKYSGQFLTDVLDIHNAEKLTWHCSRPHNDRDLRDFARLREGETCSRALARGVEMEFPYSRGSFKDRYTRQDRSSLCSTIVAHLKNDGLMFIHPTQLRSLTPREAARVQTFPDTFKFSGSRSHVFTQIGNAVPPLIGQKVGLGIVKYFDQSSHKEPRTQLLGPSREKIVSELEEFINDCMLRPVEFVEDDSFKQIWKKIHLLLPHLHPESALDSGKEISPIPKRTTSFCMEPYFIRSGWPVELTPIAQEANRRHRFGRLTGAEYFHNLRSEEF
jgi:DNA (cytosine-5)-methyltransferase 1